MYDLITFGNAPIDCTLRVPADTIDKLCFTKGSGKYDFAPETLQPIIDSYGPGEQMAGGSAANTAAALAQLGCKIQQIGQVSTNEVGQHYYNATTALGIDLVPGQVEAPQQPLLCLITPDGERSFAASTDAIVKMTADAVSAALSTSAKWLLIEGYPLMGQADAVQTAIRWAKSNDIKVAFSLSSLAVVELAWDAVTELILQGVDLLLMNDEEMAELEAKAMHVQRTVGTLLHEKIMSTPRVVTRSGDGASYYDETGRETFVDCEKINDPLDSNGAGDAFAAGFFYGLLNNADIRTCLTYGHQLGRRIIQQTGARFESLSPAELKVAQDDAA